jgi:hypothetical protein
MILLSAFSSKSIATNYRATQSSRGKTILLTRDIHCVAEDMLDSDKVGA